MLFHHSLPAISPLPLQPMTAIEFESKLHTVLSQAFPYAVLPNVRLFRPSYSDKRTYGFELDNILHISFEGSDYIIVIEAKNQPVRESEDQWTVQYSDGPKCARRQLQEHVATLREYVEPHSRNVDLRFFGIVVSSSPETRPLQHTVDDSEQYFCRFHMELPDLLMHRFNLQKRPNRGFPEILRLSQSSFLDLFRMGVPLQLLGHPEIHSAIRYVERCRRSLDDTVFQHFSPTPERWAINGSAGMGKSVLLGYAASVLSCGSELIYANGKPQIKSAGSRLADMKFDASLGSLGVFAMTQRQLDNLRYWFDYFCSIFRSLDTRNDLRFRRPEFRLCRSMADLEEKPWSAVLLDEAHDLPQNAAKRLVFRHKKDRFYLMLACDRHQRLRLAGDNARIIEGLDFASHTRRLRQIYRNPSAVYIASLALMFRWFASEGPKIIPTKEELEGAFGFKVTGSLEAGFALSLLNDAHPANSWSHTVASFPSASAAYNCLSQAKLGRREVLWVRFSGENDEFDYERLSEFTYHNFRTEEAETLNDKYIKGQDFPVVVIEGFPSFMDRYEDFGGSAELSALHEKKMWKFRRELYLCASRATCFLYFVCTSTGTPEAQNIRREIGRLTSQLGGPDANDGNGGRTWKVDLAGLPDASRRRLAVFVDVQAEPETLTALATPAVSVPVEPAISKEVTPNVPAAALQAPPSSKDSPPAPPASDISAPGAAVVEQPDAPVPVYVLNGPITASQLAEKLEVKIYVVIKDLMGMNIFASPSTILNQDRQRQVARLHGFAVRHPNSEERLNQKIDALQNPPETSI